MIITWTPQRRDDDLSVTVSGDVITINGQAIDLTALAEGEVREAEDLGCPWLVGRITRRDGVVHVPVILPHGHLSGPDRLYPQPTIVTAGDAPQPGA